MLNLEFLLNFLWNLAFWGFSRDFCEVLEGFMRDFWRIVSILKGFVGFWMSNLEFSLNFGQFWRFWGLWGIFGRFLKDSEGFFRIFERLFQFCNEFVNFKSQIWNFYWIFLWNLAFLRDFEGFSKDLWRILKDFSGFLTDSFHFWMKLKVSESEVWNFHSFFYEIWHLEVIFEGLFRILDGFFPFLKGFSVSNFRFVIEFWWNLPSLRDFWGIFEGSPVCNIRCWDN